tara:strand:- start:374 stop:559 length:186 start_codon:yes stop_codon:yes gene_type:complete
MDSILKQARDFKTELGILINRWEAESDLSLADMVDVTVEALNDLSGELTVEFEPDIESEEL